MDNKITYITKPTLPPLNEIIPYLEAIWKTKHLTNDGPFQLEFENTLCKYLGIQYISVVSNATTALMLAMKALELKGEVITTPFSFVATSHAIKWNGLKPVFCDINETDFNINPNLIEKLINKNTSAILPVHIFGNPCNVKTIETISKDHNLKVIYDAAHCFGVNLNGESILNFGDLSVLSFHATKVFNTLEGGAIISHTQEMKNKIDRLRSFGYIDEEHISGIGLNGKICEIQSAIGLKQLDYVKSNIKIRKRLSFLYMKNLKNIEGISFSAINSSIESNYAYFPILIQNKFPLTRDELYKRLKAEGIYTRKYFYPLISNLPDYKRLKSSNQGHLPVANSIANKILCLPLFPDLQINVIKKIIRIIQVH